MGVWGHQILSNDTALDTMHQLVVDSLVEKIKEMLVVNDKSEIENVVLPSGIEKVFSPSEIENVLLASKIENVLLAIGIVDASINGIDTDILGNITDYKEWFEWISNDEIHLNELWEMQEDALVALQWVKENDKHISWENKEEREKLLDGLEKRLTRY